MIPEQESEAEVEIVHHQARMIVVCHRVGGMVHGYTVESIREPIRGGDEDREDEGMYDTADQAIRALEASLETERSFSAWMTQE